MQQRPIAGAAAVAVLALVTAGCGGSHTPQVASVGGATGANGASSRPSTADQVAASRCMRSHGVPNFPDPIVILGRPRFGFTVKSGVDPNTPQFKAAFKYCTNRYRIFGTPPSQAQRAKWNAAALRFSACVRSHGARNFPDPNGEGLIPLPSADYDRLPTVEHAEQACRALRVAGVVFGVPVP